jgi:hypothetical protein
MEQNKKPVDKFFYSEKEWDRLGCGPLPEERKRDNCIVAGLVVYGLIELKNWLDNEQ